MKKKIATLLSTQDIKLKKITVHQEQEVLIGLNKDDELEINPRLIISDVALIKWNEWCILIKDLSGFCYIGNTQIGKNFQLPFISYNSVNFKIKQKSFNYTIIIRDEPIQQFVPGVPIENDFEFLEPSLTCILCNQMFYKPVQINSCQHSYCGYCITQEFKKQTNKNKICPLCGKHVEAVSNVLVLDQITKHYLDKNSDTQRLQLYDSDNTFLNKDVKYEDSDDEGQDFSYQMKMILPVCRHFAQNQIQLQYLEILDLNRLKCKSCKQEYKSFRCKENQQHERCCNYLIPVRELNVKENLEIKVSCQLCKVYRCKYYHENSACAYSRFFNTLLEWTHFEHIDYIPNAIYQQLEKYSSGMVLKFMINDIMFSQVDHGQFYYERSYHYANEREQKELMYYQSPLCERCFIQVYQQMVIKYVGQNKIISFAGKPDCPKAFDCEKLKFDHDHVNQFNHYCKRQI